MYTHTFTAHEVNSLYCRFGDGAGAAFEQLNRDGCLVEDPDGGLLVNLPAAGGPNHVLALVVLRCRRARSTHGRSDGRDGRRRTAYIQSIPGRGVEDPQSRYELTREDEQIEAIERALEELDEVAATALDMSARGYNDREIADALGLTHAAARQRLSRLRRTLRAAAQPQRATHVA